MRVRSPYVPIRNEHYRRRLLGGTLSFGDTCGLARDLAVAEIIAACELGVGHWPDPLAGWQLRQRDINTLRVTNCLGESRSGACLGKFLVPRQPVHWMGGTGP